MAKRTAGEQWTTLQAWVFDDPRSVRSLLFRKLGVIVHTEQLKRVFDEARQNAVLDNMRRAGRFILWMRLVGPPRAVTKSNYPRMVLLYLRMASICLAQGGAVIIDGNHRNPGWQHEGLEHVANHPEVRPNAQRWCNHLSASRGSGSTTSRVQNLLTNLDIAADGVCRCGRARANHRAEDAAERGAAELEAEVIRSLWQLKVQDAVLRKFAEEHRGPSEGNPESIVHREHRRATEQVRTPADGSPEDPNVRWPDYDTEIEDEEKSHAEKNVEQAAHLVEQPEQLVEQPEQHVEQPEHLVEQAAFPTEQAKKHREHRKQLKAAGKEPSRRPRPPAEQVFNDCGDDLSAIEFVDQAVSYLTDEFMVNEHAGTPEDAYEHNYSMHDVSFWLTGFPADRHPACLHFLSWRALLASPAGHEQHPHIDVMEICGGEGRVTQLLVRRHYTEAAATWT